MAEIGGQEGRTEMSTSMFVHVMTPEEVAEAERQYDEWWAGLTWWQKCTLNRFGTDWDRAGKAAQEPPAPSCTCLYDNMPEDGSPGDPEPNPDCEICHGFPSKAETEKLISQAVDRYQREQAGRAIDEKLGAVNEMMNRARRRHGSGCGIYTTDKICDCLVGSQPDTGLPAELITKLEQAHHALGCGVYDRQGCDCPVGYTPKPSLGVTIQIHEPAVNRTSEDRKDVGDTDPSG